MAEIPTTTFKGTALSRIDVLRAMAASDPNETKRSRSWFVEFEGQEYPLKHLVRQSTQFATGDKVESFYPSDAAESLEELGFDTIHKE